MAQQTHGRRQGESKGDLRQRQILDVCEALLSDTGYDAMTVSDIAARAGITRPTLYFYFGSKEEVVTALVARTVENLWERSRDTTTTMDPRAAISDALQRTVNLWSSHGVVFRTAIDQSQTVPEIATLWDRTAELFTTAITAVLEHAGIDPGSEPHQASALAASLCWMIERTFYHASRLGELSLQHAAETCEHIWLTTARIDSR